MAFGSSEVWGPGPCPGKFQLCGFLSLLCASSPLLLRPSGICMRLQSQPWLRGVGGQSAWSPWAVAVRDPILRGRPQATPLLAPALVATPGCGLEGGPGWRVVEAPSPCRGSFPCHLLHPQGPGVQASRPPGAPQPPSLLRQCSDAGRESAVPP